MPVHTAALMPFRYIRELVGGLKTEPAPDMDMIIPINVRALVLGALDANGFNTGNFQALTHPASKVLVRRDIQALVDAIDALSNQLKEDAA